mmetsp:Transcript_56074/g.114626  ORF Transcript_56074/g.114626 Transcript_56074/m.114626 type:complete len:318 (-) Transcript_56074:2146-3099(-)
MQHFVHLHPSRRTSVASNAVDMDWHRQNQETRKSWTAPNLFGRDTVVTKNADSQRGKSKASPYIEGRYYQNKEVRSGIGKPVRFWVPPLPYQTTETQKLPKSLEGVDVGSLLSLAKANLSDTSIRSKPQAPRTGSMTVRTGNSFSFKEQLWAENLCQVRSDERQHFKTETFPPRQRSSWEPKSPRLMRQQFIEDYEALLDGRKRPAMNRPPLTMRDMKMREMEDGMKLDLRSVLRDGGTIRQVEEFPHASAVMHRLAAARRREQQNPEDKFDVTKKFPAPLDPSMVGTELARHFHEQRALVFVKPEPPPEPAPFKFN